MTDIFPQRYTRQVTLSGSTFVTIYRPRAPRRAPNSNSGSRKRKSSSTGLPKRESFWYVLNFAMACRTLIRVIVGRARARQGRGKADRERERHADVEPFLRSFSLPSSRPLALRLTFPHTLSRVFPGCSAIFSRDRTHARHATPRHATPHENRLAAQPTRTQSQVSSA